MQPAEKVSRSSEERYRSLFENSPVALWEEDYSAVKVRLDQLRTEGIDFRAYLENNPEVVVECAKLVRILDVNKAALELHQATHKEQLLAGFSQFLSDEFKDFKEELLALLAGWTEFAREGFSSSLTGEQKYLSIRVSIAPGCEATWSKIFVSAVDLTARWQAEKALAEQRAFLRQVININPHLIFAKDRAGRFSLVNQATADIYGTTIEELIGKTDANFNPNPAQVEHFRQDDLEVLDTLQEKFIAEEIINDATGRPHWLQTIKRPILDSQGQASQVLGVATDITEYKRVEEELRQYKEYLEELVAGRTAELIRVNQNLEQEIAERQRAEAELQATLIKTEALYRINQAVVLSESLPDLLQVVVDSVVEAVPANRAALITFDLNRQEIIHFIKSGSGSDKIVKVTFDEIMDGLTGWVLQEKQPALSPKGWPDVRESPEVQRRRIETNCGAIMVIPLLYRGEILGTLTAINLPEERDFTAADVELLSTLANQAATMIEHKQAEESLEQYAGELQARNEELDAFAHTVAHDLQAPLGPVTGFAQILAEGYTMMPDEDVQACLQAISRNSRKMTNIIRELLLLSSVRQQEVELMPLDMDSIVAEAQQRLAHLTEEYQAEIILPAVWPVAVGYGPWVEEVWTNYLSNAIKYGGQPPHLELGAIAGQATGVRVKHPDVAPGMVRFWIHDNGPGLSREDQQRLFTPFTRLDQIQVKGFGLGLSIVRRIVEKLGGQVEVESEGIPGRGSTFSFTLPAAPTDRP